MNCFKLLLSNAPFRLRALRECSTFAPRVATSTIAGCSQPNPLVFLDINADSSKPIKALKHHSRVDNSSNILRLPSLLEIIKNTNISSNYNLPSISERRIVEQPLPLDWFRANITDPARGWNSPIICPLVRHEILATNRVVRQRRRHVRKKHRKQRRKEQKAMLQKIHLERRTAAEKKFRAGCSEILRDALAFNAEQYIRETLARSHWTPNPDTSERSRSAVHWTEIISVEELFGVPESDYIDKSSGLPNDEDWQEILELRKKHQEQYRNKLLSSD